jgi:hypothetical protein
MIKHEKRKVCQGFSDKESCPFNFDGKHHGAIIRQKNKLGKIRQCLFNVQSCPSLLALTLLFSNQIILCKENYQRIHPLD